MPPQNIKSEAEISGALFSDQVASFQDPWQLALFGSAHLKDLLLLWIVQRLSISGINLLNISTLSGKSFLGYKPDDWDSNFRSEWVNVILWCDSIYQTCSAGLVHFCFL